MGNCGYERPSQGFPDGRQAAPFVVRASSTLRRVKRATTAGGSVQRLQRHRDKPSPLAPKANAQAKGWQAVDWPNDSFDQTRASQTDSRDRRLRMPNVGRCRDDNFAGGVGGFCALKCLRCYETLPSAWF